MIKYISGQEIERRIRYFPKEFTRDELATDELAMGGLSGEVQRFAQGYSYNPCQNSASDHRFSDDIFTFLEWHEELVCLQESTVGENKPTKIEDVNREILRRTLARSKEFIEPLTFVIEQGAFEKNIKSRYEQFCLEKEPLEDVEFIQPLRHTILPKKDRIVNMEKFLETRNHFRDHMTEEGIETELSLGGQRKIIEVEEAEEKKKGAEMIKPAEKHGRTNIPLKLLHPSLPKTYDVEEDKK